VPKPAAKTFGQTVYRLRNAANMTQEQLAEKADVSRRYLQLIEAGTNVPTIDIAARIRRALKAPWDELLKGL